VLIINLVVINKANKYIIKENSSIPKTDVIIVLGAYVFPDGKVSDMLKDRLDTAYELYEKNKDIKIIVSGDHGRSDYDEVNTMRKYLEKRGIDTSKIYMDHAGFSTYESIYRAQAIFDVKSAIIVTQDYHLKRAVYIARQKGIKAYGVAADKHHYLIIQEYKAREAVARIKDFFYVNLLNPKPKFLGDKIPVMNSPSSLTHDE
jgi:SanA protein